MGWRDRLLNSKPETVGRAMKFGGGRILSQQDLPRAGMKKGSKPWGTGPKPGSHEYFLQDIHKDKRSKKQIGGRANLLEEMGRIDARRHPDAADRAEKHRVIGELNRGYNKGGRIGFDKGHEVKERGYKHKGTLEKEYKKIVGKKRKLRDRDDALFALQPMDAGYTFRKGLKEKGYKPKKIEEDILKEKMKTTEFRIGHAKAKVAGKKAKEEAQEYRIYNKGGRVGAKDGKWIQKVNASIKRRGTKGKCTPITKPGCTGKAKALAKTFKKMAAKRKKS